MSVNREPFMMCVYADPKMIAKMAALKKRMQWQACFSFTGLDEQLFAEFKALTKAGAEWFLSGELEKILKMQ